MFIYIYDVWIYLLFIEKKIQLFSKQKANKVMKQAMNSF